MIQTGLIQNAHQDLVTDVAYDFYGLRLATCGVDQRIKIWGLDELNGSWNVEDDWRAHDATVSKLSWAHPQFGSIIASGSFDRSVKIWEQGIPVASTNQEDQNGSSSGGDSGGNIVKTRWKERAVLNEAKGTVRAVEFAPHQFGLKLATISSDNQLRIYECLEQHSLSNWTMIEEIDVPLPHTTHSGSSFHSRSQTQAVATPTQTHASLDINASLAVGGAASASLVAQALQASASQQGRDGKPNVNNREADGGWCLSWCKERYWGEVLAVGCGVSPVVKIVALSPSRRPLAVLTLDPNPTIANQSTATPDISSSISTLPPPDTISRGPTSIGRHASVSEISNPESISSPIYSITSVAWAPSMGRSYHLIATGSRDGKVRIWRIKPGNVDDVLDGEEGDLGVGTAGASIGDQDGEEGNKWSASLIAEFDDHQSSIGRVEWNITGTILSSAGNDGRIRLWKASGRNVWRAAGSIGIEQAPEGEESEKNSAGAGRRDADVEMN